MLLVTLLMATIVRAGVTQANCVVGKAVSISLSHHTNGSGHTIMNVVNRVSSVSVGELQVPGASTGSNNTRLQNHIARLVPWGVGNIEQPAEGAWHLDVDLQTSSCGVAQRHSKVITFSLTGSAVKPRVPPGYVLHEGFGFFRAATNALNWTEARDACSREGAHLAFANSQEELLMLTRDFKFDVLGSHVKKLAWYGASDLAEEGKFVTVTGLALEETGFASFHPGAPQGKTTENCIFINKENQLLDDGTCHTPLAYICKVSL